MSSAAVRLTIPDGVDVMRLAGVNDEVLRAVEDHFEAEVVLRGDSVQLSGDPVEVRLLTSLFVELFGQVKAGETIDALQASKAIELLRGDAFTPRQLRDDVILTYGGHAIRPKTAGQKRYVDAIRSNTVTFGIGPAGTGKTYLAMAMAVAALNRGEVSKIVLARPVVEAGEGLGYLPGTVEEKVDPYMRPLYDALYTMMDRARARRLIETGVVEVAPLAYMRGRTLGGAFVILDEAQNTTAEQMKMFLTRLGFGSTFVVTGDLTQTDIPRARSALYGIRRILGEVDDIAFVDLGGADVVRHGLVSKIVQAYERAMQQQDAPQGRDQEKGTHR